MTRQGFKGVVRNCFLAMGLSHDASLFEFPSPMFVPGSDLTPLEENVEQIIYGLTQWEPTVKKRGSEEAPKKVAIEGKDDSDAVTKMNTLFLRNSWGDGLPLLPATEERVNWLLTGTDLPRDSADSGQGSHIPRSDESVC